MQIQYSELHPNCDHLWKLKYGIADGGSKVFECVKCYRERTERVIREHGFGFKPAGCDHQFIILDNNIVQCAKCNNKYANDNLRQTFCGAYLPAITPEMSQRSTSPLEERQRPLVLPQYRCNHDWIQQPDTYINGVYHVCTKCSEVNDPFIKKK